MARLAEKYESEIRGQLKVKFNLKNIFEVPKLLKIVVNMGVGEAVSDSKIINKAKVFQLLTKRLHTHTPG